MITDEKIINILKELKNTSPRAEFKNRMENLVIPSFAEQNKKRSYFWLMPRFLAPFLLAFLLTFTTLTSVAADSQFGDILFPFKKTAAKIQSAFVKNSPTPTPSPTSAPSPTPTLKPGTETARTPTMTKTPVKPPVTIIVKPSITQISTKTPIHVDETLIPTNVPPVITIHPPAISPTTAPSSILNINISIPKTGIHLSL